MRWVWVMVVAVVMGVGGAGRGAYVSQVVANLAPELWRGKVTKVVMGPGKDLPPFLPVRVTVWREEVIRGPAEKMAEKVEVLSFEHAGVREWREGMELLVGRDGKGELTCVVELGAEGPVVRYQRGGEVYGEAVSRGGDKLTNVDMLKELRHERCREGTATVTLTRAEVGRASIFAALDGLVLPVDEEIGERAEALARSEEVGNRMYAVDLLGRQDNGIPVMGLFGPPADASAKVAIVIPNREALLRGMLGDSYLADDDGLVSPFARRRFVVREAAITTLIGLGAPAGDFAGVETSARDDHYRPVTWGWPIWVFVAASMGLVVVARWRGWWGGWAWGLVPLMVLAAYGSWRSWRVADDWFVSTRMGMVSVGSWRGGVQVVWSEDAVPQTGLVYAGLTNKDTEQAGGWFWQHSTSATLFDRDPQPQERAELGWEYRPGVEWPVPGSVIGMHVVTVPYFDGWVVVAAGMIVLQAGRVQAWLRRRKRARRKLCVGCGFDIRTQLAGMGMARAELARCPECGREAGGGY